MNIAGKSRYLDDRSAFIKWVQAGKLRSGSVFETMKNCRKLFVNAMKFVKKNKQNIKDDALGRITKKWTVRIFVRQLINEEGLNLE